MMKRTLVGLLIVLAAAAAGHAEPPHGHGPPGLDDGPRKEFARPLTEGEIDLAIQTLREIDPDAAAEVESFRREHPQRVGMELRRQFPGSRPGSKSSASSSTNALATSATSSSSTSNT